MSTGEWIGVALVVLVALGWYLSYSAARLDRLHARVQGTLAALDAQLVRRAEATLELVSSGAIDAATAFILAGAASDSLAAAEQDDLDADLLRFGPERESAESDLTDALVLALTPEVLAELSSNPGFGDDVVSRVKATGLRVQLGRRFHNDAVTDVRRVRRKWVVRVFRLAGHAAMPRTVEFADELPPGLRA